MGKRPRHQDKDLEAVLADLEDRGWRVDKKKNNYFRIYCPCGKHKRSVALTPSNPRYRNNLEAWLHRQDCWTKETNT